MTGDGTISERMSITQDGNVGIGTTNPNYQGYASASVLSIGNNNSGVLELVSNLNGNTIGRLDFYSKAVSKKIAAITAFKSANDDSQLRFHTQPTNGTIAEVMRIDKDGQVGIGTAPTRLLHLKADQPHLRLEANNNEYSMIEWYESSSKVAGVQWIGHQSPRRLSFVTGPPATVSERMSINEDGNVGIGTTNPNFQGYTNAHVLTLGNNNAGVLELASNNDSNTTGRIDFYSKSASEKIAAITVFKSSQDDGQIRFHTKPSTGSITEVMRIDKDGNVGIGTTAPDAELTVDGTIHSEEVKVDLSVPGPDYVFAPDYDLRSLEETSAYIAENQHLPEIPSAREMEANGIDLGVMNMKLLQKVEELTLYLIEQDRKNKELLARMELLEDLLKNKEH